MKEQQPALLVVDDEPAILELLADSLRFAGFDVTTARSGSDALRVLSAVKPDLLVLDVMMPGIDGLEVARRLRSEGLLIPIVFLTARDAAQDVVDGLSAGGDDYVTKPFSLTELVARIHAVLRRTSGTYAPRAGTDEHLVFEDIRLNESGHEVTKAGMHVELSPTEFKLLRFLMLNAGRVVSKEQILDSVWHYDFGGEANIVESYMSHLRRKVDTGPIRYLQTVRGVGYVIRVPRA